MASKQAQAWSSGNPVEAAVAKPTRFEVFCEQHGLDTLSKQIHSSELRAWCIDNANRYYVPEAVLSAFRIALDLGDLMAA